MIDVGEAVLAGIAFGGLLSGGDPGDGGGISNQIPDAVALGLEKLGYAMGHSPFECF